MSAALMVGGLLYFRKVVSAWTDSGQLLSPALPQILAYTACLVVIAVVGHIVIAAFAPKEANAPVDERERRIIVRAGHFSSYVFGLGVILSLGVYLFCQSGDLLFHTVFASLIAGQIAEYLLQILFYRTSL